MLVSFFLRWRRAILGAFILGLVVGTAAARLKPKQYTSSATFLTQSGEAANAGAFSAAASLLGFRGGSAGGAAVWGPTMYVQVLQTRSVLEAIALDTIAILEEDGRRIAVMDLLEAQGNAAERLDDAVRKLREIIRSEPDQSIGSVKITVTSVKPSVAYALAERVLDAVNDFNVKTRKSQASAERQFVEAQTQEAEAALRDAEGRLETFLERNMSTGSPKLTVEHNRLQREVMLRQQVYTTLVEAREQARSREVRDTPVITMLESPRVPVRAEPRGTTRNALFGAVFGAVLGVLFALTAEVLSRWRRGTTVEERELYEVIKAATPRPLRRAWP